MTAESKDRTAAGTGGRAAAGAGAEGRTLAHWLGNLVLRAFVALALALPYRVRVPLMGWLAAHIAAPLAGWRRRIRVNLAHVVPDLPRAEVRRLCRAVPDNFGRALIEIYSGAEFLDRISALTPAGDGMPALIAARDRGTPVILVTGHFGNYDAPRGWLIRNGFRVGGLYKPMHNPWFNAHYVAAISAIGTPMFERGRRGLGRMVQFLQSGGMVGMVIDQFTSRGRILDFLGKPAPTALSAAEMALKYGALLVPIYGIREADGLGFRIVVEAPVPPSDAVTMTQALNDSLARQVRGHMDQWLWLHRRWKPELLERLREREHTRGA